MSSAGFVEGRGSAGEGSLVELVELVLVFGFDLGLVAVADSGMALVHGSGKASVVVEEQGGPLLQAGLVPGFEQGASHLRVRRRSAGWNQGHQAFSH